MTTVLGKRKSRSAAPEKPPISAEEAQAIFRRHFEAQFLPLPDSKPQADDGTPPEEGDGGVEDLRSSGDEQDGAEDDDDDDDENDEWDGVSESEEPSSIQIVDYTKPSTGSTNPLAAALARRESKAYLSSKVPLPASSAPVAATKSKSKTPTEEDSTDLLKNDLALQRLLSESHLFNPSKQSGSLIGSAVTTEHSGRNRHLATDMRLSALGSKSSVYKQAKMPMSHRKGIEGAKVSREAKRRREAKENGIILEKEVKKPKSGGGSGRVRGERAVDAPAVGKMTNGMLRLSKRDIAEIQGPVRRDSNKKRRR